MPAPLEFTRDYVEANSSDEALLYSDFMTSGEPWKSMRANNPWLATPDTNKPLEFGADHYWDTTVARKHAYWSKFELPQLTKDINQLRADLSEWGFCLIEDGLSTEQCKRFLDRLVDQAEGERTAGIAFDTPTGQIINALINKGSCFSACIEQDPEGVQAGPVIEQIMDETLGAGWISHSFLAIGADPGGYPQSLHIDQAPLLPWMTSEAPALFNTMYIPQDVNEVNGGTLVIPGSHRILIEAGSGGKVGQLPPAINVEAPAGTIMLFDGRLLHGTGVNRSDNRRYVAVSSSVKPWMRSQENWVISVAPEVLARASDKLKHRMGLQAVVYGATIEGFGLGGNGQVGDVAGDLVPFRQAYDAGQYERVGELSPNSPESDLKKAYTVHAAIERLHAAREADVQPDDSPKGARRLASSFP